MTFIKKFIYTLLLFYLSNICTCSYAIVFKAVAPKPQEDEIKYSFGSILPKRLEFFSESSSNKEKENEKKIVNKKEKIWNEAIRILVEIPLSISYANKEAGIIKTDKGYIIEFDNTNSCLYSVTVNITDSGEISTYIRSNEDSDTRIKKHEAKLKVKIIEKSKKK